MQSNKNKTKSTIKRIAQLALILPTLTIGSSSFKWPIVETTNNPPALNQFILPNNQYSDPYETDSDSSEEKLLSYPAPETDSESERDELSYSKNHNKKDKVNRELYKQFAPVRYNFKEYNMSSPYFPSAQTGENVSEEQPSQVIDLTQIIGNFDEITSDAPETESDSDEEYNIDEHITYEKKRYDKDQDDLVENTEITTNNTNKITTNQSYYPDNSYSSEDYEEAESSDEDEQTISPEQKTAEDHINNLYEAINSLKENILNDEYSEIDYQILHLPSNNQRFTFIKKIIAPSDQVFVVGDIHGDANKINQVQNYLLKEQKGKLKDNYFYLNEGIYLVFLGDYNDRGTKNIDTWIELAKLKKTNPDQVILLRGNHDTAAYLYKNGKKTRDYNEPTLIDEIRDDLHKLFPFDLQKKQSIFNTLKNELNKLFTALPQVLFLGKKNTTNEKTQYLMLTHGGVPVESYLPLTKNTHNFHTQKENYAKLTKSISDFLKDENQKSLVEDQIKFPLHTSNPFLWHDFNEKNEKATKIGKRGPGVLELGTIDTKKWLADISTKNNTVIQILRGHQQTARHLFVKPGHPGIASQCDGKVLTFDISPNVPAFYEGHLEAYKDKPKTPNFYQTIGRIQIKTKENGSSIFSTSSIKIDTQSA